MLYSNSVSEADFISEVVSQKVQDPRENVK
jgi:hypothetical protein